MQWLSRKGSSEELGKVNIEQAKSSSVRKNNSLYDKDITKHIMSFDDFYKFA
jgi:hypothetical protein